MIDYVSSREMLISPRVRFAGARSTTFAACWWWKGSAGLATADFCGSFLT